MTATTAEIIAVTVSIAAAEAVDFGRYLVALHLQLFRAKEHGQVVLALPSEVPKTSARLAGPAGSLANIPLLFCKLF